MKQEIDLGEAVAVVLGLVSFAALWIGLYLEDRKR